MALLGTIAFTYNDTVSKFLIPLQLVDPAEMPTPLSTLTTYSYMATTPSWEGVALRNWRILTKKVLSFADEVNFEIFKMMVQAIINRCTFSVLLKTFN